MGCSASVPVTIDATDVRKPADVACGKCGEVTYLDTGKETARCFNCKEAVTRADAGATGLPSAGDLGVQSDSKAINARAVDNVYGRGLGGGVGGGSKWR
jgi:hypothetical protein